MKKTKKNPAWQKPWWNAWKWRLEAVTRRCSMENMSLKISQKSQGNNCAGVFFQWSVRLEACKLIWKETLAQIFFSVNVEGFSCRFIFASHFFNISIALNFVNWLPVDFSRRFIFANLSFIKVLYTLIFCALFFN